MGKGKKAADAAPPPGNEPKASWFEREVSDVHDLGGAQEQQRLPSRQNSIYDTPVVAGGRSVYGQDSIGELPPGAPGQAGNFGEPKRQNRPRRAGLPVRLCFAGGKCLKKNALVFFLLRDRDEWVRLLNYGPSPS